MATIESAPERGRFADTPSRIPMEGWKDILWRVYHEVIDDRITLIAAGATFYLLLALFPALAAFVSLYGFVADPVTIADHIAFLGGVLPSGGVDLIRTQLQSLAAQDSAALSFGFIFGLLFALWSANSGIKTLFEALNVAYDETEKRSFIRLNLVSLLFTLGGIVVAILFIVCVGVVPAVLAFAGLGGVQEALISVLRWPVLIVLSAVAIAVLYRYGPSRERAKWRWVTWGSILAAIAWLVASILFSWYLANFANYNATYGSLGAVIGFMLWTWLSVVILLAGAEFNAELEHQTARDSTTGAELPMGARGAAMADTVGASRHSRSAQTDADRKAAEPMSFPGQKASRRKAPPPQPRAADQYATGDAVAAFALPVLAVAAGLAIQIFDRRRSRSNGGAGPSTEPNRKTARPSSLLSRGAALFDHPEVQAGFANAGRRAMEFAVQQATAHTRKAQRSGWKFW